MSDPVNAPTHYLGHPSGVEAIHVTERLGFPLGSAVKYLWRAELKNGRQDYEKARWYLTMMTEQRLEWIRPALDEDYLELVHWVQSHEVGRTALSWALETVHDVYTEEYGFPMFSVKQAVNVLDAMLGDES